MLHSIVVAANICLLLVVGVGLWLARTARQRFCWAPRAFASSSDAGSEVPDKSRSCILICYFTIKAVMIIVPARWGCSVGSRCIAVPITVQASCGSAESSAALAGQTKTLI